MHHFRTLTELTQTIGFPPPENPMIALVHCNKSCNIQDHEFTSDFYMIGFKKLKSGVILYGKTSYDHDNGPMSFVKPRQIIQIKNLEFEEDGFLILFHEDFLNGNVLQSEIKKYGYFDYEINEALHLSPREEQIMWELFNKIETEYLNNPDEYSKDIMLAHIASMLKYSQRFYKRQFINRSVSSGKVVSRFNDVLSGYFKKGNLQDKGLPTVNHLASELHLSYRYLSDLLKQETGKTAMELIHIFLISEAKHLLRNDDANVTEIAYALGFENPPYFSRLFKKEVGISPKQFKRQILN